MRSLLAALLLLAAPVASAQTALTVDTSQSSVSYTLVHKLHKVHGTSKKVEGKALLLPDGKAQVAIRIPTESFDSDNVNRDAHMKEATEAAKFPTVELKALGQGVTPPSTFPTKQTQTFKAQLSFHGVQQVFDLPVEITWEAADRVRAHAQWKISLDGYKVERPSLFYVKVDDDLQLEATLVFKK